MIFGRASAAEAQCLSAYASFTRHTRDRPNTFGHRNPSFRRTRHVAPLRRNNSSILDMPCAWRWYHEDDATPDKPASDNGEPHPGKNTPLSRSNSSLVKLSSTALRNEEMKNRKLDASPSQKAHNDSIHRARQAILRATAQSAQRKRHAKRETSFVKARQFTREERVKREHDRLAEQSRREAMKRAKEARERREGEAEAPRHAESLRQQQLSEQRRYRALIDENLRRRQEERRRLEEARRKAEEESARLAEELRRAEEERRRRAEQKRRRQQEEDDARRRQEQIRNLRTATQNALNAGAQPQVDEIFARYNATWAHIRDMPDESLNGFAVPWPLLFQISRVEDINAQNVEAFVMHTHRAGMEEKDRKQRIKAELLHWHPDKFEPVVLPKVMAPHEREGVKGLAGTVVQILNDLMAKE